MPLFKSRGVSLSSLVRGIVKALTDGQQAIPHAREEFLECHMTKETGADGVEVYKPKNHNSRSGRRAAGHCSDLHTQPD